MREYRCANCNKLLMRIGESTTGQIQVKCERCKQITDEYVYPSITTHEPVMIEMELGIK